MLPAQCWGLVDQKHYLYRGDRSSNAPGARLWNLDELKTDWHHAESSSSGASQCLDLTFKKAASDANQYWDFIDNKYSCTKTQNDEREPCKLVQINKPYLAFVNAIMTLDLHRPVAHCPPGGGPHPASANHPSSPASGAVANTMNGLMEIFKNAPKDLDNYCKAVPANQRPKGGFAHRMADESMSDIKAVLWTCPKEFIKAIWDEVKGMVALAKSALDVGAIYSGASKLIASLSRNSDWERMIFDKLGATGNAIWSSVKNYVTKTLDVEHFFCYNAEIQRQKECQIIGKVAATILLSKGAGLALDGIRVASKAAVMGKTIAEIHTAEEAAAAASKAAALQAAETAAKKTLKDKALDTARSIKDAPGKVVKSLREAPGNIATGASNAVRGVPRAVGRVASAVQNTPEAIAAKAAAATAAIQAKAAAVAQKLATKSAASTLETGTVESASGSGASAEAASDSAANGAKDTLGRSARKGGKAAEETADDQTAPESELSSQLKLAKEQVGTFKAAAAKIDRFLKNPGYQRKIKSFEKRLRTAKKEKEQEELKKLIKEANTLRCAQLTRMREYKDLLAAKSLSLAGEVERERPIIGIMKSLGCAEAAPSMWSQFTTSVHLFFDQAKQFTAARGKDAITLCIQTRGQDPDKTAVVQNASVVDTSADLAKQLEQMQGIGNGPTAGDVQSAQETADFCEHPPVPLVPAPAR